MAMEWTMDGVDGLIERDDELAVLGEVIADAIAGGGGAVLVEGEAGIGKTRLLAPARAHAAASGARVLSATADEVEATVPLATARVLLARAARGVAPDGPARLGVLALAGCAGRFRPGSARAPTRSCTRSGGWSSSWPTSSRWC